MWTLLLRVCGGSNGGGKLICKFPLQNSLSISSIESDYVLIQQNCKGIHILKIWRVIYPQLFIQNGLNQCIVCVKPSFAPFFFIYLIHLIQSIKKKINWVRAYEFVFIPLFSTNLISIFITVQKNTIQGIFVYNQRLINSS